MGLYVTCYCIKFVRCVRIRYIYYCYDHNYINNNNEEFVLFTYSCLLSEFYS